MKLLDTIEQLPVDEQIADIIRFYLDHKLMPTDAVGDAAHLAGLAPRM